ncbi:MAG: LCP family protein [Candidatus Moranbacteria bacterium]|nr:LCP family protein [Candidatus Moranbacteria bacterium]
MNKASSDFRTIIFTLLALILSGIVILGFRAVRTAERIHVDNDNAIGSVSSLLPGGKREPLRGEESGRINILLLGRAGTNRPGQNLTDTIMLASVDTAQRRVALLSIPRDLYVPIPGTDLSTKLNSLYQYGISQGVGADLVTDAVEDITGQDIPYYVTLDFDGFEKVIDDIGGIRINSERDILDTRYPGKNYSYETFELPAGWHTLDGATALKYARERHDDPEGDFGRAKRQQQILKAFQEKALSLRTYADPFTANRLLDTLGDSVRTNLTMSQIASLIELSKTVDIRNAGTAVVDAWKPESLLRVSHLDMNGVRAFILVPRTGNWNEIRDLAKNIFDKADLDRKRSEMANESATIAVISRPEDARIASRLAATLRDAIPAKDVVTATTTATRPARTTVADRTGMKMPFTFDALLSSFSLERTDEIPGTLPAAAKNADFIVTVGTDSTTRPLPESTLGESPDDEKDGNDFSEYFTPQARR